MERIGYDKDGYVYFTRKALTEMLSLVYTRDDAGNLTYPRDLPEPDYKSKYYTGKSVVSMFIPEGINCDWKDSTGAPVSIRNGQLLHGTLDAKGVKNGSMVLGAAFVYHFNYELGIRMLADFIDHINRSILCCSPVCRLHYWYRGFVQCRYRHKRPESSA